MAGNSQRRGATRRTGTKKGAVVGSGGEGRQRLEGRGPTPRAQDRPGHVAHRRAKAADRLGGKSGSEGGQRPDRRGNPGSGKKQEGREAVAGRNSVLEALQAGVPATSLHVGQYLESDDRVRDAMRLAVERGIPLLETTRTDLDRLAGGAHHQGIVLHVPPYEYADATRLLEQVLAQHRAPVLVALDGITDTRNLGAIVRSAAAFGAVGVVVPERRSASVTAAAWKTSAGAAARVPVARATNLVRWLVAAQRGGATVVGLTAQGSVALPDIDRDVARGAIVIVIGSEGKGLGHLVSQTCDIHVSIPMDSATESLNAGVAAGIALYAVAAARG